MTKEEIKAIIDSLGQKSEDDELIDILIAISVVSKKLAQNLQRKAD